jgi:hypothetical protein
MDVVRLNERVRPLCRPSPTTRFEIDAVDLSAHRVDLHGQEPCGSCDRPARAIWFACGLWNQVEEEGARGKRVKGEQLREVDERARAAARQVSPVVVSDVGVVDVGVRCHVGIPRFPVLDELSDLWVVLSLMDRLDCRDWPWDVKDGADQAECKEKGEQPS